MRRLVLRQASRSHSNLRKPKLRRRQRRSVRSFGLLPIISTHQGGFCDTYVDLAMPILEHNMRCFLSGDLKGMMNVARAAA